MSDTEMNDWEWWQNKLAGEPVQMNPDNPHAGFYRWPRKEFYGARKTFKPVAYWPGEDGHLNCRVGDEDVTWQRGQEIWKDVGNHPVAEDAYRQVAQYGGLWPDEHELVPLGDNLPPEDLSFEGLRDKIDNLGREAAIRLEGPPIENQDEADKVSNLADALTELHKLAEEERKREKKPFDDGAIEVQKRWAPLLLRAETYKNLKYKLITPWLKKVEEAKKIAGGEPVRARAGTRGKAMTLRTLKRARITDYAATLAFFANSPDVKATVQDLANRSVRAGIAVPGADVIEESQAV